MNPFFFEIVQGRSDRYSWQLVTYLGGEREVIARSSRDWSSHGKARKAAKASKDAACSARVVSAPPRPGDIRFEVVKDVLALNVTGYGGTEQNGRRSAVGPAPVFPAVSRPADAPQADQPPAGDGAAQAAAAGAGTEAAPASNGHAGKSGGDVSSAPKSGGASTAPKSGGDAQPKAPTRRYATRTKAAAAKS